MSLRTKELFDLQGFAHVDLFPEADPPWAALGLMEAYLLALIETHAKEQTGSCWRTLSAHNLMHEPAWHVTCQRSDLVLVAFNAKIEPHVHIDGPVLVDEGARIAHGATIRGPAIIGKGALVGTNSEVVRSILLPGAKAAHLNYVGDSILGSEANLGAGAVIANVRFDRCTVRVQGRDTGRNKLGALVGDRAFIRCNATLNPGKVVPKGVLYPAPSK